MASKKVRRQRKAVNPITDISEVVLRLLSEMPLASVSELTARRELSGVSRASVIAYLDVLCQRDYAAHVVRGWNQRRKRRFFLHEKGVARVTADDGIPAEWSNSGVALRRLLRQGPLIELAYHVAPRLFDSNAVVGAWRNGFGLTRLRWCSRSPLSALAEYETGLPGDDSEFRLLVPVLWYGLHPKRNPFPAESVQLLSGISTEGADGPRDPAKPCGVMILASDRLAGLRARLDLPPGIPRAIVTIKDNFGGDLIEPMDPISSVGRVLGVRTLPKYPGRPENLHAFLEQDPVMINLQGSTDYLVLTTIEEWPGCSIRELAQLCGHPQSAIKAIATRFAQSGLLEWDDDRIYPTKLIESFAEERDRLARRKSRGRAGAERSPSGKRRAHMRQHESGVIRLAIRFKGQTMFTGAGWRLGIHYGSRTQIKPDLWVLIPLGDGWAMWHAVEYERSAVGEKRILKKLLAYEVAWQLGQAIPFLMICETEAAARRFREVGRHLPMLVAVYRDVLKSPFRGEESRWRRGATRTDIDHLQDVPLWSKDHQERMQYLLVERIDLVVTE